MPPLSPMGRLTFRAPETHRPKCQCLSRQSYMRSTGCSEFHICGLRIEMDMEPVLLAICLEPNLTDKTGEYVA